METEISQLPKVELHRHLEGCITQEFLKEFLPQYHPDHPLLEDSQLDNLFTYGDFSDFLKSWGTVMGLLTEEDHFRMLAKHAIQQLQVENITYAELIFSPQPFAMQGQDTSQILSIVHEEFQRSGVRTSIIIDFVRNFGAKAMDRYLDTLLKIRREDDELRHWIRAVSIGGDEVNFPAPLFSQGFSKARKDDLKCYAHAGEWSGSESVWQAITQLGAERIGHGIASVTDPKLLEHLRQHHIGLDISITSNYLTNALAQKQLHPAGEFYQLGVPISLNTDDPGFFRTDLNAEYRRFVDQGHSVSDLNRIVHSSLSHSFLNQEEQDDLRSSLTEIS